MIVRRLSKTLTVGVALLLAVSSAAPAAAVAEAQYPEGCEVRSVVFRPTGVAAKRLPGGEVRVSWKPSISCVDGFRVHLGLDHVKSRGAIVLRAGANANSIVVGAATLRALRAPIGSGRHFNVRVQAFYGSKTSVHSNSAIIAAGQPATAPAPGAATVQTASYNLAFTPGLSSRTLQQRRPRVAKQIVASGAAVVAINESVVLAGRDNTQLGSLLSKIKAAQRKTGKPGSWKWTRSTRYAKPGVHMGGDGTRILYDAKRVKLLSSCKDKTGKAKYSSSCAIKLPRVGGAIFQRWAAAARFEDRATGRKFWFVSAHLEVRKGGKFDRNRSAQLAAIVRAVDRKNTAKEPVILGGDLNLSSTRLTDLKTLNSRLVGRGFVNAATAAEAQNLKYFTYNGWKRQRSLHSGFAPRIDHLFVRGGNAYVARYKTVLGRASDHNLIRATFVLG